MSQFEIPQRWPNVVYLVAALNFWIFWIVDVGIGGDAHSGKVEGSHYFLGSHGRFTEVSATLYNCSLWHGRSQLVTVSLALLVAWLVQRRRISD